LKKTKHYHVPLYARPRDLINVDLGLFRPEWKGQHIAGKVAKTQLVPYDDRTEIEKNSLHGRTHVFLWVDDPIDAFFLAIQGSGRVRLPNGRFVRVGYDGANGRAYVAIGRVLAEMDEIEKPVTMQKIRAWLATHPGRAQEIMNKNPSYVFFRRITGDGPIGAEGVALTPRRSVAVDPAFVTLGVPLWLDASDGNGASVERLMIAQDTGGAIKGPVRGDFFWGAGQDAEAEAGAMQSKGRYYILLPKTVAVDAGN
jgi:membrane-bound lytic murein transglycosylase A